MVSGNKAEQEAPGQVAAPGQSAPDSVHGQDTVGREQHDDGDGAPDSDQARPTDSRHDATIDSRQDDDGAIVPGRDGTSDSGRDGADGQNGTTDSDRAEAPADQRSTTGRHASGAAADTPAAAESGGPKGDEPSSSTNEPALRPPDRDADRRAAERDRAVNAKPVLPRVLQVVVAIFFPVVVMAGAVRAVTTAAFLWLEYNRPGFPADRFGFDPEQRLTYASYAMDYLLNFAGPQYLGGLVDNTGAPLFAPDEVGHMADVKTVIQLTFAAALVLAVISVIAIVYLGRRYPGGVRRSLFSGAVATLVLIIAVAVLAALGWQRFFAAFHSVFFADGTWTFAADDTLIRLFPGQFWIDAGIAIAVIVLIISVATLIMTWPTGRRRQRSALTRQNRGGVA